MCVVAGDPWAVEGIEPEKVVAGDDWEVREDEVRERLCGRWELFCPIVSFLALIFDLGFDFEFDFDFVLS